MLNLDTHVLLFAVTGALRPSEQRVLSAHQWSVSATSCGRSPSSPSSAA